MTNFLHYKYMSKYIYDTRLKGKHSCFNTKLYKKYDRPARDKIKQVLGEFVKDNPDITHRQLLEKAFPVFSNKSIPPVV